jgi:hypothetical protein
LIIFASAIVLGLALKYKGIMSASGLMLIAIVVVYAFSITSAPAFLFESNPSGARFIPTLSESAAGDFVSSTIPITNAKHQILTDWPFFHYVEGMTYSKNIGIEYKIIIIDTLASSPDNRTETTVILRQYYLQNTWTNHENNRVQVLGDLDRWNSPAYNKVFDSSTTAVYDDSSTASVQF